MDAQLIEKLIESNLALADALQKQASAALRSKHSGDMITMPPPNLSTPQGVMNYRPLYDIQGPFGGFFQDGSLRNALLNLVVAPKMGLAEMLPLYPNNVLDDKFGFLVRASVQPSTTHTESTDPCGPAIPLVSDYDFMKMGLPYGKLMHSINTIDVKNLILKAQWRQYDDFYIIGDHRGQSGRIGPSTFLDAAGNLNADLIRAAALRRKMADLGAYFQNWLLNKVWVGDPANTPTGTQIVEFYGVYRLVNGDYSTAGLPIITTHRPGSPVDETRMKKALSSIVWNANNKVVGDGTWSLWRRLLDVEELLFQRAANTGVDPVEWKIFMISPMWSEITKHIACEMAADGCTIPNGAGIDKVLNLNDGGLALYNITAREQLLNSRSLTLNGRTYEVVLDDTMPYEIVRDDQGNFLGYKGSIFFLPFRAAGQDVLYWEYVDYSQIGPALADAPGYNEAMLQGWSDDGRYYHTITTLRNCIELQTEFQMRLILKTPHLAARLDNIQVRRTYEIPMYFDGSGGATGWLVPPS